MGHCLLDRVLGCAKALADENGIDFGFRQKRRSWWGLGRDGASGGTNRGQLEALVVNAQ